MGGRGAALLRGALQHEPFVADLERFVARIRELARPSILGQLLLKLTAPGVPDIYWGDELENLSLVDPGNRRAVDWERRRSALAALEAGAAPTPAAEKLFVIRQALALRGRRPHAFEGAYRPWETDPRVFAFTRGEDEVFVAVANDELTDYEPPPGPWRDVLEGGRLPDDALARAQLRASARCVTPYARSNHAPSFCGIGPRASARVARSVDSMACSTSASLANGPRARTSSHASKRATS